MLHEFAARGSIARTADALGYTPSAVSQQLAVLEREAGMALLDRTARSAGLTDAGRRLAVHAERILAAVEAAEADLSARAAQPSGRVVVTAFPSAAVAFAPALARSLREHPQLSLLLREAAPEEGLHLVRSGEVEVAIVDDWTGRLSAELETIDSGHGVLSYYHLVRDPLVLVVARDHEAADPDRPVDLRALRNEPWLAAPAGEPSRQAADRLLAAVGLTPPVPSEFEGLGTVANLVARGLGIAIMPRLAVGAYERRVVIRELPTAVDLSRDVFAVVRTASVQRPSVAVIVSALRGAAKAMSKQATAEAELSSSPAGLGRLPSVDHDLDLYLDGPALTAALTDIASVSGEEGPLADAIERALGRLPHLAVTRHGNTLVARTALGRKERVVLAGHIDTVPHAGNFPSSWDAERTRLTGVGTSDMKAGVAVQLRLAAGLAEPSRDVTYVFYECEEVAAERNGLYLLSRDAPELLRAQFAVLLEPSGGVVEGGCQGTLRAAVTVTGLRAHTARSWLGKNAIHGAGAILDLLRAWTPRQPVVDGLEYHEGLNAVEISGGVAGNVVPDSCVVTVNYRFAPDTSADEAEAYLRDLFSPWKVAVLDVAPGARPGLTEPLAAAFAAAVGGTPRAKLGWTDVARFAELGIPAVNYGPGISEIAHTPAEYVEAAAITEAETRLRAWLTT
jgi:succinyl-diaminopimelate desuccinylase